ncbi:hypothetical protein KIPE111705_18770 [Kibdelosporangium persicum]
MQVISGKCPQPIGLINQLPGLVETSHRLDTYKYDANAVVLHRPHTLMEIFIPTDQHDVGNCSMLRECDHVSIYEGIYTFLLILPVEATKPQLDVVLPCNRLLLLGSNTVASRVIPIGA